MAILDLDLNTVYFPLNHNAPSTDSLFFSGKIKELLF